MSVKVITGVKDKKQAEHFFRLIEKHELDNPDFNPGDRVMLCLDDGSLLSKRRGDMGQLEPVRGAFIPDRYNVMKNSTETLNLRNANHTIDLTMLQDRHSGENWYDSAVMCFVARQHEIAPELMVEQKWNSLELNGHQMMQYEVLTRKRLAQHFKPLVELFENTRSKLSEDLTDLQNLSRNLINHRLPGGLTANDFSPILQGYHEEAIDKWLSDLTNMCQRVVDHTDLSVDELDPHDYMVVGITGERYLVDRKQFIKALYSEALYGDGEVLDEAVEDPDYGWNEVMLEGSEEPQTVSYWDCYTETPALQNDFGKLVRRSIELSKPSGDVIERFENEGFKQISDSLQVNVRANGTPYMVATRGQEVQQEKKRGIER